MKKIAGHIVGVAILTVCHAAIAQQFESGPVQTALIELYTSEGCSSCPPAEEYLNSLKDHSGLWKKFVPIALHVDYWDYIGWKDRFASPEHTQRQRQYARINAQRAIFTPAFFVNGKPWRRGSFDTAADVSEREVGTLKVALNDDRVDASFSPAPFLDTEQLELHVSIVGMGLKTQIRAGENKGRLSAHDFVKLNSVNAGSSDYTWQLPLPRTDEFDAERYALVAWISRKNDPRPLQAVGGFLP